MKVPTTVSPVSFLPAAIGFRGGQPFLLAIVAVALLLAGAGCQQARAPAPARTAGYRTVTIAVKSAVEPAAKPASDPRLTLRPEQEEQPAEGPQSFDVLKDGTLVIADPLADRLAFYDDQGRFLRGLPTPLPVRTVSTTEKGGFRVQWMTSEGGGVLDDGAKPVPAGLAPPEPLEPEVELTSRTAGAVRFPVPRGGLTLPKPPLRVALEKPNARLASLGVVGQGDEEETVVVLEVALPGVRIAETLGKTLRFYAPDGRLKREIGNVPIDYYITPLTEFRIRGGKLYQLLPLKDKVEIHVWTVQ